MARRFPYGEHPSQFAELHLPDNAEGSALPVAVMLHGGWWRDLHSLHLMDPLTADLAGRGWAVWNVEYRRTGGDGGGWPQTRDDVARALELLTETAARDRAGAALDVAGSAAVGHSAGGHLALLAAPGSPVVRVVGLAPVTDLERSARAGLGEGAVAPFLGESPDPGAYRDSGPLFRVPIGVPQLIVHGDADQRVPVEHSRDYVAAARAAGDAVDYREVSGADHFAVIDPQHAAWSGVRAWLSA